MLKCLLFCFSTFPLLLTAQDYEPIQIDRETLVFSSDQERNLFFKAYEEKDWFSGYFVLSEHDSSQIASWRSFYDRKLREFQEKKIPKNEAKYVRNIYNFVHDTFLRKYEMEAYFHQIFETGVYNCVTACALYGMTFEALGVPYAIKETLTHVYAVAYPATHQILIETTDPLSGYKTFNATFKQNFVAQLAANKLIDGSELSNGVERVFDKYYFTDLNLDVGTLLGIHYFNYGIDKYNDGYFAEAFHSFQKGYMLYPCERIEETMLASCVNYLSKGDYHNDVAINILAFLPHFHEADIGSAQVLGEFGRMMHFVLVDKSDTAFIQRAYDQLRPNLINDEERLELDYAYNYERSRLLYNKGNYRRSYHFADAAYQANSANADGQDLLVASVTNMFAVDKLENEKGLVLLDSLFGKYSNLSDNKHLSRIRLAVYLMEMGQNFEDRREKQAVYYRELFEKHMSQYPNSSYNEYDVGHAYSKGIVYYFRKGWYKSARSLLNQGLKYAPDNPELKMRKYYLDRN